MPPNLKRSLVLRQKLLLLVVVNHILQERPKEKVRQWEKDKLEAVVATPVTQKKQHLGKYNKN